MNKNYFQQNLLNIDFSLRKGLMLNWNFNGQLSNKIFYRHLILVDSDNLEKSTKFLDLYYKKMKTGDLFSIVQRKQNSGTMKIAWKQKSTINGIDFSKKTFKCYPLDQLNQMFQQINELILNSQNQEPYIISILTQKSQSQLLQRQIEASRNSNKLSQSFIVNVFGNFKTEIDFNSGINFFQFKESFCQQVFQFFKNYLNRIEFFHVQIVIQCQNGSLICQESKQWIPTDFNKIVKRFYGPHMHYKSDILLFLNYQNYGQLDLLLNISLTYETLDRKKFYSNKCISLKSQDDISQIRTIGRSSFQHMQIMYNGIILSKNPFKSQTHIWFQKQKSPYLKCSPKSHKQKQLIDCQN